jgi:aspartate racemase
VGALIEGGDLPEAPEAEAPRELNLLVLRTDLSGDPGFRTLLRRTREVRNRAAEHGRLPFELLADALHSEDDSPRAPLFQVLFSFERAPAQPPAVAGVEAGSLKPCAAAELALRLAAAGQGVSGTLDYDATLFGAATISTMLENFEALLAGIASHPETSLSEIPLLRGGYTPDDDQGDAAATQSADDREDQFVF